MGDLFGSARVTKETVKSLAKTQNAVSEPLMAWLALATTNYNYRLPD